jgi:RHS repeat-associated protein
MKTHSFIHSTIVVLLLVANSSFAQLSRYGMDAQAYQSGVVVQTQPVLQAPVQQGLQNLQTSAIEKASLLENLGLGSGKKPEVSQQPGSVLLWPDIVNGGTGGTGSGTGGSSSGGSGTGGSSTGGSSTGGSSSGGTGTSAAGSSGGSCTGTPGGAPCGGSGPATQGNESGTNQGAGNPINVINGNKYQQEIDMPPLPGVLGLEVIRHYNSKLSGVDTRPGLVGRGWRLSYETYLVVQSKWTIDILQADGTRSRFERTPENMKQYQGAGGVVTASTNASGVEHTWQWPDGRTLSFNGQGKLVQIQVITGEFVTLQYDPRGWLSKVIDPQNRVLDLVYLDTAAKQAAIAKGEPQFAGLQSIQSPMGKFSYHYGSTKTEHIKIAASELTANLVKVGKPSGTQLLYQYEDARWPTLLTGITVKGAGSDGVQISQRLSTYGYDEKGRANLSVKGEPARLVVDEKTKQVLLPKRLAAGTGIEQVTLVWPKAGISIITNSLGQDTEYRFTRINGQDRIVEVRGVGCAACGPANIRYGYDALARLYETTQLDHLGKPIQGIKTEFDTNGRVEKIIAVAYLNGKVKATQLQTRFEYDGQSAQPSLMVKPSVIAGKEHHVKLQYNDKRQVVQMTESGFSPVGADALDYDNLSLKAKVMTGLDGSTKIERTKFESKKIERTKIERTTVYVYTVINNRSVLTKVDGPLTNGPNNDPLDSDITLLDYDTTGSWLTKITAPGGSFSSMSFNDLGLVKKVVNQKNDATELEYNAQAQLKKTTTHRAGWVEPVSETTQYDVFGQVAQVSSGTEGSPSYRPHLRQSYDAFGRLIWSANLSGQIAQQVFDTESRLVEAGRYTDGIAQLKRVRYNAYGQPVHEIDNALRQVSYGYNAAGNLEFVIDPAGRLKSVSQSETSERAQRPTSLDWADDFGRVVAVTSVDTGLSLSAYDAADRLIGMRDAMGRTASYHYDTKGRMIRQVLAVGQADEVATTWRYQADHLVTVDHPSQSEQFTYDARGLRISKTVTVKTSLNQQHSLIINTHYEYDTNGVLQAQTMADGSRIVYERDQLGQITKLKRTNIQTEWLRSLGKEQIIAENIQRDVVGISRFTTGNGIQTSFQRSPQGILARVVHSHPGARGQRSLARATDSGLGWPLNWPQEWDWGQHRIVDALMGIVVKNAVAATAQSEPTKAEKKAVAIGAIQIGAMGSPADKNAIVDQRYLWDPLGNLAYTKELSSGANKQVQTEYAYDNANRLVEARKSGFVEELKQVSVSTGSLSSGSLSTGSLSTGSLSTGSLNTMSTDQQIHRYFYKNNKRVLAQEPNENGAGDFTKVSNKVDHSHRASFANEPSEYSADGMPIVLKNRTYQWDAAGRLIQINEAGDESDAASNTGHLVLANYQYDHRGLRISKTTASEKTHYAYDDQRQLTTEMNQNGQVVRQYIYMGTLPVAQIHSPTGANLQSDTNPQASIIWQDIKQIVATAFGSENQSTANGDSSIHWIHTNHLGAPLAATNTNAQTKWQADYAPFGGVKTVSQNLNLEIRLPGQYHDKESGLYYNRQRYYDPARGEYLSPDPLGNPDGPNGYAYVNYNPLRYVDPDGLTLFAFDGTENTDDTTWLTTGGRNSSLSNVAKFKNAYGDGVRRYVSGVGTDHIGDQGKNDGYDEILAKNYSGFVAGVRLEDRGGNYSGPDRIKRMQLYFNDEVKKLKKNEVMEVDIVGFSRGAAEARDFANKIVSATKNGVYTYELHDDKGKPIVDIKTGKVATACGLINFRFMGLWDTVLSTNFSENEKGKSYGYALGIPSDFKYVAHAVALNEYRSAPAGVNASFRSGGVASNTLYWDRTRPHITGRGHYGGFPLHSIGASNSTAGRTRIELGFVGAHADIGGGYGASENGLASVALSWMFQQAHLAGVKNFKKIEDIDMRNPIIHDQSNAMQVGSASTARARGLEVEDRQVLDAFSGRLGQTMGFNFGEGTANNKSLTHSEIEKQKFINYATRDGGGIDFRTFDKRIAPIQALNNRTGNVNMVEYMKWLREHGYQFYGD